LRIGLFLSPFFLTPLLPAQAAHTLVSERKNLDLPVVPTPSLMPDPASAAQFPPDYHRDPEEHYHWKGLLLQSFEFSAIENSFRIASDDQIRGLLANKPYWHDYVASLRQFNMRRWNDGDNFLVNYVGHPLEGAVSGYIQIQNDPEGKMLEFSNNRDYWQSRARAFL
jgi:hypothetical protein